MCINDRSLTSNQVCIFASNMNFVTEMLTAAAATSRQLKENRKQETHSVALPNCQTQTYNHVLLVTDQGGNCDTLSLSPPLTSELFSRQKSPHKAFIWFAHCITLYNHISLKTTLFPSLCSLSRSLSYKMISHTLTSLLCSIVNSWSMRFCYTTHTPLLISARQKRQNGVVEE